MFKVKSQRSRSQGQRSKLPRKVMYQHHTRAYYCAVVLFRCSHRHRISTLWTRAALTRWTTLAAD